MSAQGTSAYTELGSEDPVRIEVPAGGYKAVVFNNRTSPAEKYYRRGWLLLGNFMPGSAARAEHPSLQSFCEAIYLDADHAAAHASKAEAEIRELLYRRKV